MKKLRRLAGVYATPQVIGAFVLNGECHMRISSPIPETANFFSAYFDQARNVFVVIYEDDSFEVVPEGAKVPILERSVVVTDISSSNQFLVSARAND